MDKKKLSGLMMLSVFLSAVATYEVTYQGTPYLCKDTGQVCIGTRLSSTGKTCYYQVNGTEKGKLCGSMWEVYRNIQPEQTRETYLCSPPPSGCLRK